MRALPRALTGLLIAVLATASAHAVLTTSEPEDGAVLTASPETLLLSFTEGVEVDFSVFRLVRLDAEVDLSADNARLRLNGLASAVVGPYLGGAPGGEEEAAVEAVSVEGDRSQVKLTLSEPLSPGHYVLMWRVLSEDTHVVDGHIVFSVEDGE